MNRLHIITIFRREYGAYFNSPIAYVFAVSFLLITGGQFMMDFFIRGQATMRPFFMLTGYMLILFIPALAMRLWSEEQRQGTLALLQSLPMTQGELVMGKFLAGLLFYLTVLAGTLPLAGVTAWFGDPDMGMIISGYFGTALLGALFLSAGMWAGAFLTDQIASFILGVLLCFLLFFSGTEEVARFLDGWVAGLGSFLRQGLGTATHFDPFVRGVIPMGDMVYFLSFIVAFLCLNTYTLNFPLRLAKDSYASLMAFLVLGSAVFLSAFLAETGVMRLDLTERNIYSLSPESGRILEQIPYPLDITYFVSPPEVMPSHMKQMEREVTDRMKEFAATSERIRFRVSRIMNMDSPEAADLARRGIIPFTVRTVNRDAFQVTKVYSALTISYLDRLQKALPQLTPQTLPDMEYRLISSALKIQREKAPYVSLYGEVDTPDRKYMTPQSRRAFMRLGSRMPQVRDRYSEAAAAMKEEGYRFERISLTKEKARIPRETDCLVVMGAKEMDEQQAGAVKDFLASGRSVVLALQNQAFEYRPGGSGGLYVKERPVAHGLEQLLNEIGCPLSPRVLMDEAQQTVRITRRIDVQGRAGGRVKVPVRLPVQVLVGPGQINRDFSLTEGISRLFFLWGNAVTPDMARLSGHGLELTSLFTSSSRSWEAESREGGLPADYFEAPEERAPELPLGVMIRGDFSWLTGDAQKTHNNEKACDEANPNPAGRGSLTLIGSGEMFKDGIMGQGQNRLLLLNLLDTLTLGGELLPLRARTQPVRYIRPAGDVEKIAARLLGVVMAPALIVLFGAGRFMWRRRRRSNFAWGRAPFER